MTKHVVAVLILPHPMPCHTIPYRTIPLGWMDVTRWLHPALTAHKQLHHSSGMRVKCQVTPEYTWV